MTDKPELMTGTNLADVIGYDAAFAATVDILIAAATGGARIPSLTAEAPELYKMLSGLAPAQAGQSDAAEEVGEYIPAVSVRKSLASPEHIISMIDGKPYKTLRRHLATHGLTPEEYRERYGLKADYPMVSEAYSASRREMALKIGLGKSRASNMSGPV